MANGKTSFYVIYNSFLDRIEDSMYMQLTEVDTYNMLQSLLLNAIPRFKLPRFDIFDYEEGYMDAGTYKGVHSGNEEVTVNLWRGGYFNSTLTLEEINILSISMIIEWFGQQLATTELTRMKYSGSK